MLPLLAVATLERSHAPRTDAETKPWKGWRLESHPELPRPVGDKPTGVEPALERPALERPGGSGFFWPAWWMAKAADDRLASVLRTKIRPLVSAALILAMLAAAAATTAFFGVHIGSRPQFPCAS